MREDQDALFDRLLNVPPFDRLSATSLKSLKAKLSICHRKAGDTVFREGDTLDGLYVILSGSVEVHSSQDELVSHREAGDILGERGLLRDGYAMLTATAPEDTDFLVLAADAFHELMAADSAFHTWFERSKPADSDTEDSPHTSGLMSLQVADLMVHTPITCVGSASVQSVAQLMRDNAISSVLVMEQEALVGIVTVHDLVNKVLAQGVSGETPVASVMSANPFKISEQATGLDALLLMAEHRINHLPVTDRTGAVSGMIGRTDLFRQQAATASHMAAEIVTAENAPDMAEAFSCLPVLLTHLTAAGTKPAAISRRITDLTDAATRRLLTLAEKKLGAPPVPYLWAACGSQGRREQTGVSDQDNILILDDAATKADDAYFAELAKFVSDGLATVGFIYCPGDMMATNPRWRQPLRVWKSYFEKWIAQPDEEAQMLASVMFDLRPIAGDESLFNGLQSETLACAKSNSIFVRHMIGNSLKHTPPLGLFRGLAPIRSGEHKNAIDLKHAGVVPMVDLARVYALRGALPEVNTRDRIVAAGETGVISKTGARDLLDAYDLIAELRLNHQATQIAKGQKPDNYLFPVNLSDLERNHLRDAFLVVKTMQSALGGSA